jgi:NodT family efflux transporter outer membrane factor (OMF) lipoprotein
LLKIHFSYFSGNIMNSHAHVSLIILVMFLECCLVFSSCTVAPVQNRKNIPDRLPEQYPSSGKKIPDHPLFWEQSFPSQSLRDDILTLLDENFELAAARARVKQAAAAYGMAGSALMPTLDGQGEFERSRVKQDNATTTQNTIAFEAALHWEPDIWGRLRARRDAAALSFREQQAQEEQTALDLQTLLVESWVIHHGARRLEQVLVAQWATNKQLLNLTELRLALGQGNALDVLQQRGCLVATERALPAVASQKRRAANAYAVLLGHLPDGRDPADGPWPTLKQLTALTSPRQLLVDRPDLRAAFLALQVADHEVAAAIADRLPRLSIGWSYEASGGSLATIGDDTALRFTSGLLSPIFDAGRLRAKMVERKAEVRELLALLEHAMLVAVREVEDALSREQALFDEHRLLKNEMAIALDTVEKAKLRYVNGQETYLAVLVALANLQTLQQNEMTLQQELLINRGRLLKALGAKWSQEL